MINGKLRAFRAFLQKRFPKAGYTENFSLARHTTVGCGGCAAAEFVPYDIGCAAACLRFLEEQDIPYYLLGAGANVLPSDDFFDGVIVRFSALNAIERQGSCVCVGAGVTGGRLLRFARECGLGGLEPFTGIPMTVGGGIAMNAGIACRHFSDVTVEVVAIRKGETIVLQAGECGFGQKQSVFQSGMAVVQAKLSLTASSSENVARESAVYRQKRAHLPKGRSMGCTFVNPENVSAGALIEACGLKGLREGNAYVSEKHANFIINEGRRAADIANLIEKVKSAVYRQKGVSLREEIRRIPPQTGLT